MNNRALGKLGEQHARTFLEGLGYQIVTTNFYTRAGEIDIIAKDHESLVFVEVKARTSSRFGYPESGLGPRKLKHFMEAVELYLIKNNIQAPFRLDVIGIEFKQGMPKIRHYQNVTF